MSQQKWIRSSLRQLCCALSDQGHRVSRMTIRGLLLSQKITLKANIKRFTGSPHPDRDQQFKYIHKQKQRFQKAGLPVISVDTKKKELIGNFKNPGRSWQLQPHQVNVHDFPQDAVGRAVPYGIYELNHNRGYIYVGSSADTAQFAVEAIALWWQTAGLVAFPKAKKLLILCDAGGSNSYRSR